MGSILLVTKLLFHKIPIRLMCLAPPICLSIIKIFEAAMDTNGILVSTFWIMSFTQEIAENYSKEAVVNTSREAVYYTESQIKTASN